MIILSRTIFHIEYRIPFSIFSSFFLTAIYTNTNTNTVQPLVDDTSVVSGHQDGSLRLWDIARTPNCVHTMEKHHTAHVTSVAYSPRTSYHILTSSKDNTLAIVDLRNFSILKTFKAPQFRVSCEWSRVSKRTPINLCMHTLYVSVYYSPFYVRTMCQLSPNFS
jgi:WD40 repeat protein